MSLYLFISLCMFYVFLYLRAQLCDLYIKCDVQKKKNNKMEPCLFDPATDTDVRFPSSFFMFLYYIFIHFGFFRIVMVIIKYVIQVVFNACNCHYKSRNYEQKITLNHPVFLLPVKSFLTVRFLMFFLKQISI